MKKTLMGVVLSTVLATTAIAAQAAESIKVGFANRTLNGAFFNGLTEYMKINAKAKGYDLITTDARGDMNKQIADVEDMLSQGINYLILNPQDPAAGIRIAEIAKKRGVPTFILDSDISLDAPVVTRVQANNAANNIMIGEYAVSLFGNKPINCAIISGNQGNLVGEARRSNFMKGIMESQLRQFNETKLTIVSQGWGNWDQQGGLKSMEDIMIAHGDKINCLYSEMDDMALGAIRALKAANQLDKVMVFAHDGYSKALESISKGELKATASNNPKLLTEKVLDVVASYHAGERSFPDYIYIKPILITKDNVKENYDPDSLY